MYTYSLQIHNTYILCIYIYTHTHTDIHIQYNYMLAYLKHFVGRCWYLGWFRLRPQDCKLSISTHFLLVNHPRHPVGWGGLDSDVANLGAGSLRGAIWPGWAIGNCPSVNPRTMWRHSKTVVRPCAQAVRAAIPVGHGTADKHWCWPLSNALLTSLEGGGFTFVRWTMSCWRQESPGESFGKITYSHKSKDSMFAFQHRQQLWFEC